MRWYRVCVEILFVLGLWAGLMAFGPSAMLSDPGTFWHTTLGENMLRTGLVPRDESFSFTFSGRGFVSTSWLAECGMAGLYRLGGWDAALLATTAILAIVFGGLAVGLVRAGLHPLGALLLLALALGAASQQFHVRPLILSMALLALVFRALADVEAGQRPLWHLVGLVPLTAFWANCHGGVLGGLGTLAICAAGWVFVGVFLKRGPCRRPRDLTLLAAIVAGSIAAVLVNPYAADLPRTWWTNLRLPLGQVLQEHAPLDPTTPYGVVTALLGAAYAGFLGRAFRNLRVTWLVPLVWYVLGCLSVRHAALFAITALAALADIVPQMRSSARLEQSQWLDRQRPAQWATLRSAHPAVLVAAVLAGLLVFPVVRGWARIDPRRWPVALLETLRGIPSEGQAVPVFNDLTFGGYLVFYTPGLRVFIDDRAEVYQEFLFEYERARRHAPWRIEAWRRRWGFRYALVEAGSELDRYLAGAQGWRLVGRSPPAALYQRSPLVGREPEFLQANCLTSRNPDIAFRQRQARKREPFSGDAEGRTRHGS